MLQNICVRKTTAALLKSERLGSKHVVELELMVRLGRTHSEYWDYQCAVVMQI